MTAAYARPMAAAGEEADFGQATGTGEVVGPVVVAVNETGPGRSGAEPGVEAARWAALAEAVLRDEQVARGELGLLFVDPERMAELNREHMDADGPTDVLAFPLDGAGAADGADGISSLIGDVVVCPARAARQAPDHRGPHHDGSLEDELALLVVHGVLHVLGYDHASGSDAAVMRARQDQMLAAHHRSP